MNKSAQRTLTEWRIAQAPARTGKGFFCVRDLEHALIVRLAFAEPFQQRAHLRIKRNGETGHSLVPKGDDSLRLEVHVGGSERPGFRLAESGQSEEFEKVGAVLRVRIESAARARPQRSL